MRVLGIDIGGTEIKAGIVDGNGRVLEARSVPTPADLGAFQAALREAAGFDAQVEGAGIGCKGVINPRTTRVEIMPGTVHFLEGTCLAELVRPLLGREVPVAADNDARVAMAGEMVWGAARGRADALMLTLGTGVGGAAVVNGGLLRGQTGAAGHLGHVTIDADGPLCICGNHGCLETCFSAKAIEAEAFRVIHFGCESRLTEWFRERPREVTCQAVFEAAAEGDGAARRIVERAIHRLSAALAGLLHIFDPEVVIVGGRIAAAGEALFDPLRREVAWRTRVMMAREVPVVRAQIADHTGVVGAAALVMRER